MLVARPLLVLCVVAGLAPEAHARKTPPAPCAPGAFELSPTVQARLETAVGGAPIDRIAIGPGGVVALGHCEAAGKLRPTRKRTGVTASWKICGTLRKVRLTGSLAFPSCDTLKATIRAKGLKAVRITSRRLPPATTTTTTLPGGGVVTPTTTTLPAGGTTTTTTTTSPGSTVTTTTTTTTSPGSTVTTTTTTTTSPGSTVTTTTVPGAAVCGDGVVGAGEACEGLVGCAPEELCTTTCACAARAHGPITSQQLIADALAGGTIDYPTSLLYRAWALFNDSRIPREYDGEANAGEDLDLIGEIVAALGGLGPEWQAALEPFLLRPTESASYFSAPPGDGVPGGGDGILQATAAADPKCPIDPDTGQPDWRPSETPHFVIWSCGDNDPADPTAAQRVATGVIAEQLWTKMTPELGPFKGDSHPAGPAPQSRIDVYLLDVDECRQRDGVCNTVPRSSALAMASPAGPCDAAAGGPHTSSGYVMMRLEHAPEVAPGLGDDSDFRATLAHELFHLFEYKSNLRGMGRRCQDANTIPRFAVTWLTESSAEWAAWAFVPDDSPSLRTVTFDAFQQHRPPATTSLKSLARTPHPYQAFIYHSFRQQESGGSRVPMVDLWANSPGATTPDDLERGLDAVFPFAEHFRDFAVRNVNPSPSEFSPGNPVTPLHADQDPAILPGFGPTLGVSQYVVQPDLDGVPRPVDLAPLTAQYERHDVSPDARYVKLDFSDVPNGVALDLDVLARVQGEWKRIRVDGSVFEFCRDDPAEDIDRYLLVVTNHDHQPDGQARGNYRLTTEDHCPARWSGTIDFACTDDETESFSEVGRSTQRERHEVERQRWTIVGQGRGPRPDQPPGIPNPDVDYLELAWNASLSVSTSERIQYEDCLGGPSLQTGGGSGTATARERVNLFPSGDDIMPFPEVVQRAVEAPTVTSIELCSGQSGTIMGEVEAFGRLAFLFLDVPALQLLTPEPDGTITVSGSKIVHELVETTPEGERVLRCDASWNVRRRLAGL